MKNFDRLRKSRCSLLRFLTAAPLSLLLALGCSGDGDDDGKTDAGNPDTGMKQPLEPNFTSIYFDLLSSGSSCAGPGCHDSGTSAGGQDYASGKNAAHMTLLAATANVDGVAMYPNRVVPNQPDMSFLMIKISRDDAPGGRMPLAQTPLDQADIDAIRTWIMNGANND